MPSTQTPPFRHGCDSHLLRFTSQNNPPNPRGEKKGEKKMLLESFTPGFIPQPIRISMTLFSQTEAGFQSLY